MTTFSDDVVSKMPGLQKLAQHLAGNRSEAHDLVQETVLRALLHADQFHPGTNLRAWLNTILRHCFLNEHRIRSRIAAIDPLSVIGAVAIDGDQESHVYMCNVSRRFADLSSEQRDGLVLVGGKGYSYESAAKIAGCRVGTMKSRVSRARTELRRVLEQEQAVMSLTTPALAP